MDNKRFDVINCIDNEMEKSEVLDELTQPVFGLGQVPMVLRLLDDMIEQGLIKTKNNSKLEVTSRGRKLCESYEYRVDSQ